MSQPDLNSVAPVRPIRVLLAGMYPSQAALLAASLSLEAGVEIVGTASDAADLLHKVEELSATVVVLPVRASSGLNFCQSLRARESRVKVLLLEQQRSGAPVDLYEYRCISANAGAHELGRAIRSLVADDFQHGRIDS